MHSDVIVISRRYVACVCWIVWVKPLGIVPPVSITHPDFTSDKQTISVLHRAFCFIFKRELKRVLI